MTRFHSCDVRTKHNRQGNASHSQNVEGNKWHVSHRKNVKYEFIHRQNTYLPVDHLIVSGVENKHKLHQIFKWRRAYININTKPNYICAVMKMSSECDVLTACVRTEYN